MPDFDSARGLELDADLRITLSSNRGDAAMHLHGGKDGLILDVDHPGVLLTQVRGQELPLQAVRDVISDTPVRVRSQGRVLARLRLTSTGKVRVRPTPAGLMAIPRVALFTPRRRLTALLAGSVLATSIAAGVIARSRLTQRR